MNIIVRIAESKVLKEAPYFQAFPEGREDLSVYGTSADTLCNLILDEGIEGLEYLSTGENR